MHIARTNVEAPTSRTIPSVIPHINPLLHPLRQKQVRLVARRIGTIAGPDQPLAVRAEHREAIESRGGRDLLRVASLFRNQVNVELPSLRIAGVRAVDYL